MARLSRLEETLALQLRALTVPRPAREYRFALHHIGLGPAIRRRLKEADLKDWRFDFAWPDIKLAAEVEGGAFSNGRHTRGVGFTEDIRKYHSAMMLGWTVYRCDARLIESGEAANFIELKTK